MATAAHPHPAHPHDVDPLRVDPLGADGHSAGAHPGPTGRRRHLLPVTGALVVTLLLVGCTGSASTSSSSAGASVDVPAAAAAPAGAAAAGAAAAVGTAGGPARAVGKVAAPDITTTARSRVLTASVTLQVADVAVAAAAAARAATAVGGYVGTEQLDAAGVTKGGNGRPSATSTLRVPPARLKAVLATVTRLGKVTAQQRSDTDVTGQVADLDARLVTQRASLVRLRGLFAGARDLPQVTALEQALTSREADLESVTAQRKALAGQVDDATVTVTFTAPVPPAVVKASTPVGFGRGLAGGWSALVGTVRVAAATLGALVPFLPVIAVVALLVLWRRRVRARRDGGTPDRTAPPDHTAPPAGPPAAAAG